MSHESIMLSFIKKMSSSQLSQKVKYKKSSILQKNMKICHFFVILQKLQNNNDLETEKLEFQ